jgi:hypothetical protein
MYLEVLAEAVNAVADWPLYCAICSDEPRHLLVGYKVGRQAWHVPLKVLKSERVLLLAKFVQLNALAKRTPLPLRPYPYDQLAREVYARSTLLSCASEITNIAMRRETAKWITFLGRLRADPSGVSSPWDDSRWT